MKAKQAAHTRPAWRADVKERYDPWLITAPEYRRKKRCANPAQAPRRKLRNYPLMLIGELPLSELPASALERRPAAGVHKR